MKHPIAAAFLLAACASKPASKPTAIPAASPASAPYQAALEQAVSELQRREARSVASPRADRDAQTATFRRARKFEVLVYPRLASPNRRPGQPPAEYRGEPERLQFRVDRQGHCALGAEVVPAEQRSSCVQVEIKPLATHVRGKQFVRVFMSPDYAVYGLSYHEFDADRGVVARERRVIGWDPSEPLSSEQLSVSRELVPLDLPVHARNGAATELGTLTLSEGPRAGRDCQGWQYKYKNIYGSRVSVRWCQGDAWPTEVRTDRYVAVLAAQEQEQE